MRKLVIYHGECPDGFCAAWVAWDYFFAQDFVEPLLVPMRYQQALPWNYVADDIDVYLLDWTCSRTELERIAGQAHSVTVLDHHETARERLAGWETIPGQLHCEFDMARSGAGLTWDHFYRKARPWLVDYVEDRDLWRFALPDSRQVNAYINTLPYDLTAWDAAHSSTVEAVAQLGKGVLLYLDSYVASMLKLARKVEFHGHMIPVVNAPFRGISELVTRLAEVYEPAPFALGWWQREDGAYQYSLRSVGDFHVGQFAQTYYGGGGHPRAAGFTSDKLVV